MTMTTLAAPTSEWETDQLDLDAYLTRIGVTAAPAADVDTLRRLHRAHAETIAFENLDVVLGRTIELDLDRVQDKLVRRRRGGYCFEHNLLLAAVLERLGFSVTRLAARVQPARPGPRTHMLLRVAVADGGIWLADVGFGASLLEPLQLQPGETSQGAWAYRLAPAEHAGWLLQTRRPDGWSDLYAFTLEGQRPIDYAVYNHYTATHPRSPFTGLVVALRTEPDVQHALRGLELTTTRPNGATETLRLTPDEAVEVLGDLFAISLDEQDATALLRLYRAGPAHAIR